MGNKGVVLEKQQWKVDAKETDQIGHEEGLGFNFNSLKTHTTNSTVFIFVSSYSGNPNINGIHDPEYLITEISNICN